MSMILYVMDLDCSKIKNVIANLPVLTVSLMYCKTSFDSDGLTATKIVAKTHGYRWNSL